jgi:hypothetical protein
MQLMDPENYEFTLSDILTPKLSLVIKELPKDIVELSDQELIIAGKINDLDWKIRIKFWQEFRTIMDPNTRGSRVPKIKITNVINGLCEHTTFSEKLANPYKAAFFFRPMSDFEEEAEMVLQLAGKRLWEIISMDITGKDGKVDPRRAMVLLAGINTAADRSRGLALMRTQSVNVNIDKKSTETTQAIANISDPYQLDKKIKELEAKLGSSKSLIIEGETIEGDC